MRVAPPKSKFYIIVKLRPRPGRLPGRMMIPLRPTGSFFAMRDVWMKSHRPAMWIGGLVVLIGLALSVQVFSLFGKLTYQGRAIRLLSAEVERRDAQPVPSELSGSGTEALSLRLRLRSKDKEIDDLLTSLMIRNNDLDTAQKEAGDKGRALRTLRVRLEESEAKLRGLIDEREGLEGRLRSLAEKSALDLEAREGELDALKKKNAALTESVSDLKRSVKTLFQKKKKAEQPRLPKELLERIKNFGNK